MFRPKFIIIFICVHCIDYIIYLQSASKNLLPNNTFELMPQENQTWCFSFFKVQSFILLIISHFQLHDVYKANTSMRQLTKI